jgi:hypothetical protein
MSVEFVKKRRRSELDVGKRRRIKKYLINAKTTRVAATFKFKLIIILSLAEELRSCNVFL